MITHDGITQPVEEWALDYGITPELIEHRMSRGWSPVNAIETPMDAPKGYRLPEPEQHDDAKPVLSARRYRKRFARDERFACGDQNLTLKEWSKITGIKYGTIRARLVAGRSIAEAMKPKAKSKDRGWPATSADRLGTGGGSSAQDSV